MTSSGACSACKCIQYDSLPTKSRNEEMRNKKRKRRNGNEEMRNGNEIDPARLTLLVEGLS